MIDPKKYSYFTFLSFIYTKTKYHDDESVQKPIFAVIPQSLQFKKKQFTN